MVLKRIGFLLLPFVLVALFGVLMGCRGTPPAPPASPSPVSPTLPSPTPTRVPPDPLDYGVTSDVGPSRALFRLVGSGLEAGVFSPNGDTFFSRFSALHGGPIMVWDAKTGTLQSVLSGGIGGYLAISPDGSLLAHGGMQTVIELYDLPSGEHLRTLEGHSDPIAHLVFAPSGSFLASDDLESTIIWDTTTWEQRYTIEGSLQLISEDGAVLITGNQRAVTLWDTATWQPLCTVDLGDLYVMAKTAFSADGTGMASGSFDSILLWDLATGAQQGSITLVREDLGREERLEIEGMAFAPDGRSIAVLVGIRGAGGRIATGDLIMLDRTTGEFSYQLTGNGITSMSFNPDGSALALGTEMGDVMLLDSFTGEVLCRLVGHGAQVSDLLFSPDGTALASTSDIEFSGGEIILWDVTTCQ
jgi:WD40 repeat protein